MTMLDKHKAYASNTIVDVSLILWLFSRGGSRKLGVGSPEPSNWHYIYIEKSLKYMSGTQQQSMLLV